MAMGEAHRQIEPRRSLAKKIDVIGWGLFLIWVGIAFLADVGWGAGLLGIGVIALGGQAARRRFELPVEPSGLVIGVVFAVWGLWELLNVRLGDTGLGGGLLPILCIVAGLLLVLSASRRTARQ